MNPAAVLALLGALYEEIVTLREANAELRAKLEERNGPSS